MRHRFGDCSTTRRLTVIRVLVLGVLAYGAVTGCTSDSDKAGKFSLTGTVRSTDGGQVEVAVTEVNNTDYTSERLVHVDQYVKVQNGYVWDFESCDAHRTGRVEDASHDPISETELEAGQHVRVEGFVHKTVYDCRTDRPRGYDSQLVYDSIQVVSR
jgi:hypothetical protein